MYLMRWTFGTELLHLSVLFQVPDINIDELEFDFEMDVEEEDPIVCNHVGHLPHGN